MGLIKSVCLIKIQFFLIFIRLIYWFTKFKRLVVRKSYFIDFIFGEKVIDNKSFQYSLWKIFWVYYIPYIKNEDSYLN